MSVKLTYQYIEAKTWVCSIKRLVFMRLMLFFFPFLYSKIAEEAERKSEVENKRNRRKCFPSQFLLPQIDFKETRLILSRLLVNNPVNNPFSRFHAVPFVGFMVLGKSEGRSCADSLQYPPASSLPPTLPPFLTVRTERRLYVAYIH